MAGQLGEALTRSELLSSVWGSSFDGSPNVVDVYVGYVRAKLKKLGDTGVRIDAVRGVGFRLTVSPTPERA
jgi:two-component system OmpR family response regulator